MNDALGLIPEVHTWSKKMKKEKSEKDEESKIRKIRIVVIQADKLKIQVLFLRSARLAVRSRPSCLVPIPNKDGSYPITTRNLLMSHAMRMLFSNKVYQIIHSYKMSSVPFFSPFRYRSDHTSRCNTQIKKVIYPKDVETVE